MVIQQEDDKDIWEFKVLQDVHNHEYTHNPNASASTRALDKTEDFKKLIRNYQKAGILVKLIYNTLKLNDPKTLVIIRDITNERTRAKFEELEENSSITAFFKNLDRKFNN